MYQKKRLQLRFQVMKTKIEALIELLKQYGIREVVRTGLIAIERGNKVITKSKSEEDE